jgi:hypothetical protein
VAGNACDAVETRLARSGVGVRDAGSRVSKRWPSAVQASEQSPCVLVIPSGSQPALAGRPLVLSEVEGAGEEFRSLRYRACMGTGPLFGRAKLAC